MDLLVAPQLECGIGENATPSNACPDMTAVIRDEVTYVLNT